MNYRRYLNTNKLKSPAIGAFLPILLLFVFLAFFTKVLTPFFDSISNLLKRGDKSDEKAKEIFNQVAKPVVQNMTFDLSTAAAYASRLYNAMHRVRWIDAASDGTDEQAIFSVFEKIRTKDDMRAVYNAFGTPEYNKGIVTTGNKDLLGWLSSELTQSEMKKIQSKLNLL